jgi:hypothetical protein
LTKQIWRQFALAHLYNIQPSDYYHYRLFDQHKMAASQALLVESVKSKLLDQLNRETDCTHLNDKVSFYNRCTDFGLPVIPLVAVIRYKQIIIPSDGILSIPHMDIFLKRSRSTHGIGAELWEFIEEDNLWSNEGQNLCEQSLIQHLYAQSSNCAIIVQPRIKNHPGLEKLSLAGLCTVRIVTYRFPNGEMGILSTVIRMPRGLTRKIHEEIKQKAPSCV